ncbi:3-dehydroquinate synthase [bacterium]|nr:3-dehydroquinate synthase [bacterium]
MTHIFLYGPSGSGKSTVGYTLAKMLALPFIDLDREIEKNAGQSIPQIMSTKGEHAFRNAETRALEKAIQGNEAVIALGGGALLREENRSLAEKCGHIILLDTNISTLAARLERDNHQRPLLVGDLSTSLQALLESRKSHYASFPLRVDASAPPEEVAWNIQKLIGRFHLRGMGTPYDAWVQTGGLDSVGELLMARGLKGPVLIISDTNVAPLYAGRVQHALQEAGYPANITVIPAGEAHKNIETVTNLWTACLEANLDRKSTILALGGGVVSDLAGFTAATFMRGFNWVAVPTTLLAMVDASLGGKTGFDLPEGKNMAGAFYPPKFVLADPQVLNTLPQRELRSGLAEVVKHGVIADPKLFDLCRQGMEVISKKMTDVVKQAMAIKVKVIEADPYEQGIRAGLNFGHTIGHAVEHVSGYQYLHGEAVAIGMVAEARLAEKLSIAHQGLAEEIAAVLIHLGLPVDIPANLSRTALVETVKMDKKKRSGKVRFALPTKIGEISVGVEITDIESIFEEEK